MTPTIDRLAGNGVRFPNAYSACPVCMPARRALMTGLTSRSHGLRSNGSLPMPDVPTMAQCFRDAGYQAHAVGKLHVSPPRSRIGFDDALINEEGRHTKEMSADDWELYLAEQGHAGKEYAAGGTQNDYMVTPWHLPEECHQTSWTAREMCKTIKRRDSSRPAFWYMSFAAPHPPLWPLEKFLDQYQQKSVDAPLRGSWVEELKQNPPGAVSKKMFGLATTDSSPETVELARRAFYAMITHIDHQIRMVLGTLREERLAGNTIVAFVSDHGEMLGDHDMWGKAVFYDSSAKVPFIVVPPSSSQDDFHSGTTDSRIVELCDLMPTLLELAGIPVPESVEGFSVFSQNRRDGLYGEHANGGNATRMFREERFKLIYYPDRNLFQLFDLESDPAESTNLAGDPACAETLKHLQSKLSDSLYGEDTAWVKDGVWTGLTDANAKNGRTADYSYGGQRGYRFL